jgi:hypothetical protein
MESETPIIRDLEFQFQTSVGVFCVIIREVGAYLHGRDFFGDLTSFVRFDLSARSAVGNFQCVISKLVHL